MSLVLFGSCLWDPVIRNTEQPQVQGNQSEIEVVEVLSDLMPAPLTECQVRIWRLLFLSLLLMAVK